MEESTLCPDRLIQDAVGRIARDEPGGLQQVERLIADYPTDARLHFWYGSLLAAARRYDAASSAMSRAVELAPDFDIARFQLGFLAFTSGDAARAADVWRPLLASDPEDPLRLFAEGLERLAVDDFAAAAALLRRGIELNRSNPAQNKDMQLLLDAIPNGHPPSETASEPISLTQLALQHSVARKKKH